MTSKHTITEIEENRKFKLENKFNTYIIKIPKELKPFEKDLILTHNIV